MSRAALVIYFISLIIHKMQKIKTMLNKISGRPTMQWESFELGSKKILFDDEEENKMRGVIDDLGLEGQKSLIEKQDGKIIPFPLMSRTEDRVWEVFCPTKTKLEEYSSTVIPYEILQIIKLCQEKKYFGHIEIWSEPKEEIDPIVVGVLKKENETLKYLLCRWGLAMKPFEQIVEFVKTKWMKDRKIKIEKRIRDSQNDLENLESDAMAYFEEGNWINSYF